jgi:ankyrin repeat protein
VKQLSFALLFITSFVAAPAIGQSLTTHGYDFIEAVKKSDGDKATQILDSQPQGIVNTKDADGNTPLIIAISRSDEQWTSFLMNKGADPNLGGRNGDTPLIAAARVGFEAAVEWLISVGAKVDGTNHMGETPLIIAVQQHQPQIVRVLLAQGADPDRADHAAGYSARDYATRNPRARDLLKMIEDKKPKPGAASAAK